ncbi:hypothetical protein SRHO_G00124060 [Serrasalmus rhombeus]
MSSPLQALEYMGAFPPSPASPHIDGIIARDMFSHALEMAEIQAKLLLINQNESGAFESEDAFMVNKRFSPNPSLKKPFGVYKTSAWGKVGTSGADTSGQRC